jgi:hypothetical protein
MQNAKCKMEDSAPARDSEPMALCHFDFCILHFGVVMAVIWRRREA